MAEAEAQSKENEAKVEAINKQIDKKIKEIAELNARIDQFLGR